jgi:ribonuclease HI
VVKTLTEWAAGWERRGWRRAKGEIANLELVQRAWGLFQARPKAKLAWLRGHVGQRWNERADALANEGRRRGR